MRVLLLLALSLPTLCQGNLDENQSPLGLDEIRLDQPRPKLSGLGEANCLISRIDAVPCKFLNNRIQTPGPNEFGVYQTRYRNGPDGFPRCQILARNHEVHPVQVIGSTNQVITIFSPGAVDNPPVRYYRDTYVEYNIQCGRGRLAFMHIREMNLEPKNCRDPNRDELKCVDYVLVGGGQLGDVESCGDDLSMDYNTFPQSSLRVIFRSSRRRRFPGFAAHIICFEPEDVPDSRRGGGIEPVNSKQRPRVKLALGRKERKQLDELIAPHFEIARQMARSRPTAFRPIFDTFEGLGDLQFPPDFEELPVPDLPPSRKAARQPPPVQPMFSSRATFTALAFENTLNPILRAAARSITEDLSRKAPERLASLRTKFAAPDFVMPDLIPSS